MWLCIFVLVLHGRKSHQHTARLERIPEENVHPNNGCEYSNYAYGNSFSLVLSNPFPNLLMESDWNRDWTMVPVVKTQLNNDKKGAFVSRHFHKSVGSLHPIPEWTCFALTN